MDEFKARAFVIGAYYKITAPAVRFTTAASRLAHSVKGDFNLSSRAEVEALMGEISS